MKRLLSALVCKGCTVLFVAAPSGRDLHDTALYNAAFVLLHVIAGILCVAGACQGIQGISELSDKWRMHKTAQRATWNALQVSGKE